MFSLDNEPQEHERFVGDVADEVTSFMNTEYVAWTNGSGPLMYADTRGGLGILNIAVRGIGARVLSLNFVSLVPRICSL
jgi:hypothetical protein